MTLSSAPGALLTEAGVGQPPRLYFLTGFFFYLHIWLLWDHSLGESVGQPLSLSSPQAHPCASPPMESLGPKVLYVFLVTLY